MDGTRSRVTSPAVITAAGIAAVAVVFAVLAWERRWLSDDGLIVVRVARQIAAGHGPVFNVAERVEASTSVIWPWLLGGAGVFAGNALPAVAVYLGLACAVGGVVVAMDACRRWARLRGSDRPLVPCGALVVLGLFSFWDFATSGLETGLVELWIAGCWWLLVCPRPRLAAFVFGLGPLVRPDLAVMSAVFLVAGWWVLRPARRQALVLAAIAIALPLAYEVFRAGYYGVLVPMPALAKSASHAEWSRGAEYVWTFMAPHLLWFPLALGAAALAHWLWRGKPAARDRVIALAPVIAGALHALFVMRVGGDFMHARLLLPATFALVLPAMLVPLGRPAIAAAAVAIWALWNGLAVRSFERGERSEWDERIASTHRAGSENPTDTDGFVRADRAAGAVADALTHPQHPQLVTDGLGQVTWLDRRFDAPVGIAARFLGTAGAIAPLDGLVVDLYGLANPIGARITPTRPGAVGHEKLIPWLWVVADVGDPALDRSQVVTPGDRETLRAARHALRCDELAELMASVRAPMSAGRFWDNLIGAWHRTRIVIPSDPLAAERELCP